MKTVIDRKTYDTDTAEFLIRYCADCPDNDFNYYEERLYKKKKTGEYFIHGMGGALSPYRKIYDDGNTLGWGETIFLLTEEEAKKWVINHFKEIDYEHVFGKKRGSDSMKEEIKITVLAYIDSENEEELRHYLNNESAPFFEENFPEMEDVTVQTDITWRETERK